ncbi:MAG: hypothetical protein ACETVN_06090 [Asgard group archaeon]
MTYEVLKYEKASILAFISGIIFVLIDWHALPQFWEIIVEDWLIDELPEYKSLIRHIFRIIFIISFLGGITVIFGALAIANGYINTGRFLIMLGIGISLLKMGFLFITSSMSVGVLKAIEHFIRTFIPIQWFAIILAILAQMTAKKKKGK